MIQGAWLTTEGSLLCTDTYDANVAQSLFGMLLRDGHLRPVNSVFLIVEYIHTSMSTGVDANGDKVTTVATSRRLHYCDADAPGPSFPVPTGVREWVKQNIAAMCAKGNLDHAKKWSHWMEG